MRALLADLPLSGLPEDADQAPDFALAARYLPVLRMDDAEPFRPLAAGYVVYREEGPSLSSKFIIRPRGRTVIEYAIWYDWDIQHLYDLEHVWVHVEPDGSIARVEASRHGARRLMRCPDGALPVEAGRPVLYLEPGKHAHWADDGEMRRNAGPLIAAMCGAFAGDGGVHLSNRFSDAGRISASPLSCRLARLALKRMAFSPSWQFSRCSDEEGGVCLMPWPMLDAWVPRRVEALVASLETRVPHLAAVFLDCGDTLVDERTEVKIPGTEVVTSADLIPGAGDMLHELVRSGYRLALVADGPRATFENILKHHGLWDCFEAHIISGDIGELKPSPKMFAAACEALGLAEGDRARTVMVGNNLERDILGANRFGLISIFLNWSTRRSHKPGTRAERPMLTFNQIGRLPDLLEKIELSLPLPGEGEDE
ncbi:HAD family hydrolase [Pannonibacter indicus]|uniref:Haloacid dehalogenase superfamily, subfamily IA, variant 1 with third motif having Dx(3-4)D or Dx(3-4)E n=1 Tax=Pannonibacter indicus TaxID=466044 RepID=A0A0K6I263_9HYPH|nr:HAD-IA family hydrolase [Pannonibacter indicus]CUA97138.1 haloacid dehalogenase superfamily, subfamily IA, variant 1 with third motif having Dx(3-4)D or Dx(3-4)E [Pannonibacter indicus]